jgi:hypothetical protein
MLHTASVYYNQDVSRSVLQIFLITEHFWPEKILTEPYTKTNHMKQNMGFLCGRYLTMRK